MRTLSSAPPLDYRALFELGPSLYLALDSSFTVAAASDEYLRATMTRRQDIIGHNLFDIFPDNPRDSVACGTRTLRGSLARVLKDGQPEAMPLLKYDIKGPDGAYVERYWSTINSPIFGAEGKVDYILHRTEDVTDFVRFRRQDESAPRGLEYEVYNQARKVAAANEELSRELSEREELYRVLIDGIGDYAIYMLDPTGHVKSWSSSAERIKGYKAEEIIGRHFSIFFTPEHRDQGVPETVLHTAASTGRYEAEAQRVRKDGSLFWASMTFNPLRGPSGELVGFVKVTRDISQRKDMEQWREQLIEKLTESNTELERFAYICSHDLQEPLRMISSFSQRLENHLDGKLDAKAMHYMKYVTDGALHARQLINDVLNYARLNDDTELFADIDSHQVLQDVLQDLSLRIQETGARVTHGAMPVVHIQPTHLRQVLQNLISNALKFCTETPSVYVGVEREGDFWRFSVRDNGIGIAPEYQGKLFAIFQRLHTREQYPGTGIGLAVCKKVTSKYGGRIGVESCPGKGSTFFFTVPRPARARKEDAA